MISILPNVNEPYPRRLTLKVMREEEEEEQQQQDEIIWKLSCNSSNLLPKLGLIITGFFRTFCITGDLIEFTFSYVITT